MRHHFIRIAKKRRRAFLELNSEADLVYYRTPLDLSFGRFADEQPYLGCHRPRCGLCHPDKRWHRADRAAADRAWRTEWLDEIR